jgi:SPP1 gp7 family putative phage head morphogenesis protein
MLHLVHHVRAHNAASRVLGRRARTGRVPKPQPPLAIEADYARQIIAVVHSTKPVIDALVRDLPDMLSSAHAARGDARDVRLDVGESSRVRGAFERARTALHHALNTSALESVAQRYAATTSAFQRAQLARQVKAALGIDIVTTDHRVPTMIEHFIGENVSLIKSLGERSLGDVEKIVTRAFTTGARAEDVAGDIADRYGISERHARLIARDQIGSLNGQIAAARQQEIGVTSFVWRDAGDERVRPEHEALNGETFSYDDPPDEGLPGEPVCCRCYAEPVFTGILGEAQDE